MLSTKSLVKQNPKFAILSTVFIVAVLTLSMLMTAIKSSTSLASAMTLPGNQTSSSAGGNNMTMPGGNMTFGASLQNAKMHLMEGIMDLKIGDTKGATMELNLTSQDIKMHEQELKTMMMGVKSMVMKMKGNVTSYPTS
jgi:hypothetical protein